MVILGVKLNKQEYIIKGDSVKISTKVMIKSIIVNTCLVIIKMVSGLLLSSSSLIADGIHSLSDLLTDFVAIFGNLISLKPADEKHPYGHGKVEYITSIFIGISILIVGFLLISETSKSTITIPKPSVILIIILVIFLKFLLSRYLIYKGKKLDNAILLASGKESSTDVYSSLVVLVSSICMQLSKSYPWLKYADKVAIVLVAILIIKMGYTLLKENLATVIGAHEEDEKRVSSLKDLLLSHQGVLEIFNLQIIKYGHYDVIWITVGMEGNKSLKEASDLSRHLEKEIMENDIKSKFVSVKTISVEDN